MSFFYHRINYFHFYAQVKKTEDNCNRENSKTGDEEEDLEAVLINNLKFNGEDGEFDLNSPLSNLFDESDDISILNNDMMIQSSTSHFQHPRQPSQNYAHCVNGYRQNNYQVKMWHFFNLFKNFKRIKTKKRVNLHETIRHGQCNKTI